MGSFEGKEGRMDTLLGSWKLLPFLTCAPGHVCNRNCMATWRPGQHQGRSWFGDVFDLQLGLLHAFCSPLSIYFLNLLMFPYKHCYSELICPHMHV